jgi:hypothetical protein
MHPPNLMYAFKNTTLFIEGFMIVSCEVWGKTSYGGCFLARVSLRSSPFIER